MNTVSIVKSIRIIESIIEMNLHDKININAAGLPGYIVKMVDEIGCPSMITNSRKRGNCYLIEAIFARNVLSRFLRLKLKNNEIPKRFLVGYSSTPKRKRKTKTDIINELKEHIGYLIWDVKERDDCIRELEHENSDLRSQLNLAPVEFAHIDKEGDF